jgi:CDP-2,3-bis-(O-geranylgeranyl)-sn-glycerol synthase
VDAELTRWLTALLLVTVANGTPVIAKKLLGQRFAFPLDGGSSFLDGRPVFGPAKTVRGVVLAIAATALAAPLLGVAWQTGALLGTGAMLGDLLSSFVKRRLGMASSSQAFGLDQVPESLLPLYLCRVPLGLSGADIAALVVIFLVAGLALSRVLYRLRVRDRPY